MSAAGEAQARSARRRASSARPTQRRLKTARQRGGRISAAAEVSTTWKRFVRALIPMAMTALGATAFAGAPFAPPATPSRPVVETLHGVTLTDRYRWLESGKDAEVETWTRAQHAATLSWLDANAPPVPGLRDEIARYVDRDVTQPPFFRKGREFFLRTRTGEPQPKVYTRLPNEERLLFDPVALDPTGKTALGRIVPNRDGSKLAIATYSKGSEISDYRIVDSMTGAQIGPIITGLRYFSWARDERFAYISPRTAESDARQEPPRCLRHRLGSDRRNDELLIALKDAKEFCAIYEPDEAEVTVFETGAGYGNTLRIRPIGSSVEPTTIWSSEKTKADALFRKDRIYIRTNDGAPNWKLMAATYARPTSRDWTLIVPEQDTVLEGFDVTSNWIVVVDKKDVLTRVFVHDLAGKRLRELPLPELGNVAQTAYDIDANRIYARVASFTSPGTLYALDGVSLDWKLLWKDNPPLDTSQIAAEREFVTAKDGARIPVFVVHRKDVAKNADNPTLLYGYGGFNIGISPFYIATLASFVNRGGVFVYAGIRGGDEYGERWHEQAMNAAKQTTFDDFIAVAEWLVRERYTKPSRLAIEGGSNGGLLVAAMLTQRPDLFTAALCQVPLTDMVRYHKFLIARYWIPEYGDPDRDEDFRWLLRYSPYENVRDGVNLPTTMVTAGEYDSRVDPLHAKKFVAAVQNHVGQVSPFLLYMDFDSGHGFGKSRRQTIDDRDYELRFLMNALGMNAAH
jgi:prolyl oligopeptidase